MATKEQAKVTIEHNLCGDIFKSAEHAELFQNRIVDVINATEELLSIAGEYQGDHIKLIVCGALNTQIEIKPAEESRIIKPK